MSRNLQNEAYYTSNSKKIPVKWTAPEVITIHMESVHYFFTINFIVLGSTL